MGRKAQTSGIASRVASTPSLALESRISSLKLIAQTDRSAAEDLDMVKAISDFQNKQTGYEAALKSYAMVQKLSLFQYISG